MRKICLLGIALTSVSAVALAQTAPALTDQIEQMVRQNVMSEDVEYTASPSVKALPYGYEVNVPAGMLKTKAKTAIKPFVFSMTDDGMAGVNKRYKFKLTDINQIFPSLSETLKAHEVVYSDVSYEGKFIPALGFLESQEIIVKGLKIPFKDTNSTISAAQATFTDFSRLTDENKAKQEDTIALKDVEIVHPLASLHINEFKFDVSIPEANKATSPMEQVMLTPSLKQSMTLNNIRFSSPMMGDKSLSFDATQTVEVQQDQTNYNVTTNFGMLINNIKGDLTDDMPRTLTADIETSGYTFSDFLVYSAAINKLSEAESLPDSTRKEIMLKTLEDEVEKAQEKLIANVKIDIKEMALRADKYTMVLKGNVNVKSEQFKGTLQVTNFDYLAPQPKKIDEVACQKLVDDMLSDKIKGAEFKAQYDLTCDEGRGILDGLRPFADSAAKVTDAQGNNALLFSIEFSGDDMFINGHKIDDDSDLNPKALIGD